MEDSCRFDGLINFRDVGKTINDQLGSRYLRPGTLFRSARPDGVSAEDVRKLHDFHGIKTVIDLRTKAEQIRQLEKLRLKSPPDADVAEPLQMPGFIYHEIDVNGRNFERALFWKLSLWSRVKVLAFMFTGYRIDAIKIMIKDVIKPRGLIGLACDSIDDAGDEIRRVFDVFADPSSYPILIHCTQGKDRTGLIIALVLFLLDVPPGAISHDYTLSESELRGEREVFVNELHKIGMGDSFTFTPSDWVEKVSLHLTERHGGVSRYLSSVGIDEGAQATIRNVLTPGPERTSES